MKVLDLFSGIGGMSYGLQMAGGFETVQFVEIEPYCQKVLAKNFPGVPIHGDIRTFQPGRGFADVVVGGFPCQPFSVAGKRAGTADDRDLWPEMARVIQAVRPTWVLGENVAGFVQMELDRSLSDLESLGYACQAFVIPACAVDAQHRRDRVWIVAHTERRPIQRDGGFGQLAGEAGEGQGDGKEWQRIRHAAGCGGEVVADTRHAGSPRTGSYSQSESPLVESRNGDPEEGRGTVPDADQSQWAQPRSTERVGREWCSKEDDSNGFAGRAQWLPEPPVGGSLDGLPLWLDRFVGWGMSYEASRRCSRETLPKLWGADVSQALWRAVGGLDRFLQAQVLFAVLRQYEKDPHEARLLVASEEALDDLVRSVRRAARPSRASRRSGQGEQSAGEHPDALQVVSRVSSRDSETAWSCGSWEDGVPRVANGGVGRVDRLRGLGNAVVPQLVAQLGKAILNAERVAA